MQGDYRELPFADDSFDLVLNLFSAIGYWGDDGDLQAFREFRRVLRPGGRAVVETMHRDRLARIFRPTDWHDARRRTTCCSRAASSTRSRDVVSVDLLVPPARGRAEDRPLRASACYTATELAKLLREAGFERVEALGGYDGSPFTLDSRLVAVAS